jgi:hypothetical protein
VKGGRDKFPVRRGRVKVTVNYTAVVNDWVWIVEPGKSEMTGQVTRLRPDGRVVVRLPGTTQVRVCPSEWVTEHERNKWV